MAMKKHIVVAGSTGEVGKLLVKQASACADLVVHALVRRKGVWQGEPAVHEIVFDYEDSAAYAALFREVPCDVLLIALGTTTAKSGVEGLLRVDRDYPLLLIEALERSCPQANVGFCSSAGADNPRGHYLKAKADVERHLQSSRLATAIARPSFLISERKEFRPLEKFGLPLFNFVFGTLKRLMPKSNFVWTYAPISTSEVAECLLVKTLDLAPSEHRILQGKDLYLHNF